MSFDLALFERAYYTAGINWIDWRDCYEFQGQSKNAMPVIKDDKRFKSFASGYKVLRGIDGDKREHFRKTLSSRSWVDDCVRDLSGDTVQSVAEALSVELNTSKQISALSKLTAFAMPDRFIAIDHYAAKGLARLSGRPRSQLSTYPEFLAQARAEWETELGEELRMRLAKRPIPTSSVSAFGMRVFDVYLMGLGGRS